MYSNLLKLLIRNQVSVINKDVINVPVNQYYSNPPFTKETYIVLTIRFLIRDVRIKKVIIDPPKLPNEYWKQFKEKFKPKKNFMLNAKCCVK